MTRKKEVAKAALRSDTGAKKTAKQAYFEAKAKGNQLASDLTAKKIKAKCACVEPKQGSMELMENNMLFRIGLHKGRAEGREERDGHSLLDAVAGFTGGLVVGAAVVIVALQLGIIS